MIQSHCCKAYETSYYCRFLSACNYCLIVLPSYPLASPFQSFLGRIFAVHGFCGRRAALLEPGSFLGLLCPAQDAVLHMLVEDLHLVVAPHLLSTEGDQTINQCLNPSRIASASTTNGYLDENWERTHLGYNCIKRQCAVAAEKLNDDPAGTYNNGCRSQNEEHAHVHVQLPFEFLL